MVAGRPAGWPLCRKLSMQQIEKCTQRQRNRDHCFIWSWRSPTVISVGGIWGYMRVHVCGCLPWVHLLLACSHCRSHSIDVPKWLCTFVEPSLCRCCYRCCHHAAVREWYVRASNRHWLLVKSFTFLGVGERVTRLKATATSLWR